ncbi:hypothetical protein L2E68_22760 [Planktothrix agardhii 1029]|uniref:Uncharacterized protein n=1 Tax=Planktothrix agardhii (strain NIVA-CYA 126/8) TaxID=388467 RepID=A0A073CA80_PLAA1|nr:hypothetical protein [Planktothrix agardhii]KEI65229.1 hypothetical protein A19Y_9020 [Planktothrix agardhii NIVA-CYA 126/8]MCB8766572.1 hypothetical protein [Planktothrix agardhii 1809]MCB8780102.1 hypothetical protein [Planktothrix agardhii 1031]MCB8784577.1 hypothetical protein [Planktothrix agardhii 1808]MCF3568772.1 hypothetical protein [Planktothrix agardhii 1807]
MKTLKIVNYQKHAIAQVNWESPDKLTVQIFDPASEIELNAIIERSKQTGIPYRTGGEKDANLMIDEQQAIGPNHENFLEALSGIIGQLKFGGQRVFGLIQQ